MCVCVCAASHVHVQESVVFRYAVIRVYTRKYIINSISAALSRMIRLLGCYRLRVYKIFALFQRQYQTPGPCSSRMELI